MRKIFVLVTVLLFVIFSCNKLSKKQSSLLGIDKLTSQLFKININKDTVLKTLNGAILDIPKGSISATTDSLVQLEIKEAYSIEKIIRANLTTQSNGQPLSSGGMIYINAAGGQIIKITKAIRIAIPTKFLNNKMQLYKGEQTDSGIKWTNPTPLTENAVVKKNDTGELLFKNNCSSCHKVDADFTGPALAHVIDRKGKDWVYHHAHDFPSDVSPMPETKEDESINDYPASDSIKLIVANEDNLQMDYLTSNSGFYYLACLKQNFGTNGTNFPNLKTAQFDAIYTYIKNETGRLQVPYPNNNYSSCLDSCEIYYATVNKLLAKRKGLQKDSVAQKVKDFRPPAGYVPSGASPVYPDNSVEHEDNKSLYYQFKIDVVGWYNIDALLNSFDDKMESELRVRIVGTYKSYISINLVVPIINTFLEGGKLSGKEDEYGFFTKDGKIPLPKNAKAYIIAMGETNGQLVFAKKEFIVSEKQSFEVSPEISTVEEFNASIKAIGSGTVNIKAIETPTGKELKENDKQLKEAEKLKPKNCNCDCGLLK